MIHKPVIIIALTIFTLVGASFYFIANWQPYHVDKYITANDCQIASSSCVVALDEQTSIKVDILPRGIPETDVLAISIDIQGDKIDNASVAFEGIEIDTITPRYRLYKQSERNFSGKGFLAICTLSKMHWIAHFHVMKADKVWAVSFPFEKNTLNLPTLPLKN